MKNLFNAAKPVVDNTSLTSQMGKTAVISAASTAGMVAGLVLAGTVKRKIDGRKARKNASTETTAE